MDITGGTRVTAVGATVAMLGGLALTLHGIQRDHVTCSIGGVSAIMVALTAVILLTIRGWITDTRAERAALAAAQRETQAEQTRYIALQAALENERGRLAQDIAAERARLEARLKIERDAMTREFQEQRDELIAETVQATVLMHRRGKLAPDTATAGRVIRFPEPQPQPQRERSREHGVVGP